MTRTRTFSNKNKISLNEFKRTTNMTAAPAPAAAPLSQSWVAYRQRLRGTAPVPPPTSEYLFKGEDFPSLDGEAGPWTVEPLDLQGDWARGIEPVLYGLKHAPDPVKVMVIPKYVSYDDSENEDYLDNMMLEPTNDWDEL